MTYDRSAPGVRITAVPAPRAPAGAPLAPDEAAREKVAGRERLAQLKSMLAR